MEYLLNKDLGLLEAYKERKHKQNASMH
jgi:hypothetical protein